MIALGEIRLCSARGGGDGGIRFRPKSKVISLCGFLLQIQVYGFNAELYHNMSEAQHKSQGLVAISLMVQVSEFFIERTLSRHQTFPSFFKLF